jgi:hypothetical protein
VLIDLLIKDQIANIEIPEAPRGPRGFKGKDGDDFNLEDHKQEIIKLIEENSNITLSVDQLQALQGKDGVDGKDGKSVSIEDVIPQLSEELHKSINNIKEDLRLKFSDLTGEEILSITGPRGHKGSDGIDFVFEDHSERIEKSIKNLISEIKEELKLKFSDFTEEEKLQLRGGRGQKGSKGRDFDYEENRSKIEESLKNINKEFIPELKLKFSDLTEEEIESIRGPKGLKGSDGEGFRFDDHRADIQTQICNYIESVKDYLKLTFEDLTPENIDSLKLKFSNFSEEEKQQLKGVRGQRGKAGQDGENGLSAYEVAVIKGYHGSQEEWIKSLKGEIGPRGISGVPGISGRDGKDGKDGRDGEDGKDAPRIVDLELDSNKETFSLTISLDDGSELTSNRVKFPATQIANYYSGGTASSGGGSGSSTPTEYFDEGITIGTASKVNFSGAGVSSSKVGDTIEVVIDTPGIDLEIFQDMNDPTGFVNRVDSVMSFNETNRTFTISPYLAQYSVYIEGTKLVINSTQSLQIPNTSGGYFFYINSAGILQYSTTYIPTLFQTNAICSYIYWDAIDSKAVSFGEERHGITMDGATHAYLHSTRGTQLVSGANIVFTVGDGNLDSHAEISLGGMRISDEDITIDIIDSAAPTNPFEQILSPVAQIPVWYREGDIWKKKEADNFPMIVGTNRAKFNEKVGVNWQLTEAPSNNKTLVTYIFATTNIKDPVVAILGQDQYQNIAEAKLLASWDSIDFGELPSPEMKILYILYYDTSSTFSNLAKSRILEVADIRYSRDREIPATSDTNTTDLKVYSGTTTLITTTDELEFDFDDFQVTDNAGRAVISLKPITAVAEIGVYDEYNLVTATTKNINFIGDYVTVRQRVPMSEWDLLNNVNPDLSSYLGDGLADTVDVFIDLPDSSLLKNVSCLPDVYVGSFVIINSSEIAENALADEYLNSNVIGLVESKSSPTVCDIRVSGISSGIFSALDTSLDYYLSDSIPGGFSAAVPTTSGHIKLKLGQAFGTTKFLFSKGERVVRL